MNEPRVTSGQAARALGTTRWTLRDLIRDGKIAAPPLLHARLRTWSPAEIEAVRVILEERRRRRAAHAERDVGGRTA